MPKLTLEFSERDHGYIEAATARKGITKADLLRRALNLFYEVKASLDDPKATARRSLAIAEDGKVLNEIIFI